MTIVELDLFQILICIKSLKKGVIEGVRYIAQRCSKANNNILKSYDKDNINRLCIPFTLMPIIMFAC